MAKEEVVYCRVGAELKKQLEDEAARRGEAESVIVREALREYFEKRADKRGV